MRALVRLAVLAAAVLLVLPAGALQRAQYYCRMMERTVVSCCCKAHEKKAEPTRGSKLESAGCCELVTSSDEAPSATRDSAIQIDGAAVALRLQPSFEAPGYCDQAEPPVRQARAPPSLGPPLFLANCTLLI